jgi:tetrahedral aminopeptidase
MDKNAIGGMLRSLVEVDGPSGMEGRVASLVRSLTIDLAHEARNDALGNTILLRRGQGAPANRIMLAAHIDEIGLIVTKIDGSFLHVGRVGGVVPSAVAGGAVTVYPTGPGSEAFHAGLAACLGARPPHVLTAEQREKPLELRDLRVDLGRPPAFLESGIVRIGDRVVPCGPYTELLGGRVASKALDDRAGVAAMLGALGYLSEMRHSWDVLAVATVQEEIGLRGAVTSAYGVAPDVAIAIDVTFADTPGVDESETVAMDCGPAIGWGPNLHPGVVRKLREVAEALEIPYVTECLPGASGTDAWALQVSREGIPTGLISLPIRYMHATTELAALADVDRAARLLASFIGRLDGAFLPHLAEEV